MVWREKNVVSAAKKKANDCTWKTPRCKRGRKTSRANGEYENGFFISPNKKLIQAHDHRPNAVTDPADKNRDQQPQHPPQQAFPGYAGRPRAIAEVRQMNATAKTRSLDGLPFNNRRVLNKTKGQSRSLDPNIGRISHPTGMESILDQTMSTVHPIQKWTNTGPAQERPKSMGTLPSFGMNEMEGDLIRKSHSYDGMEWPVGWRHQSPAIPVGNIPIGGIPPTPQFYSLVPPSVPEEESDEQVLSEPEPNFNDSVRMKCSINTLVNEEDLPVRVWL